MNGFPDVRLRRYRQTQRVRDVLRMPAPAPNRFIWPIFVIDGDGTKSAIDAMPGQSRLTVDLLAAAIEPLVVRGIGGVLLFGVVEAGKDEIGSCAHRDDGIVQRAVREIRSQFPDLLILTDVCLCGYTTHGHCGVLNTSGAVDNDVTLAALARMAVSHARAGADGVAPSAMMDGQVQAIRRELDNGQFINTLIMSYSTKFASALYGPFREAAKSAPGSGTRASYQAPYDDRRQAIRESMLDVDEGADILMVKPALYYLDILYQIRQKTELPLAAYQVSGEYAMAIAAARAGYGDQNALARESLVALCRAGADLIITYWANQYATIFPETSAS